MLEQAGLYGNVRIVSAQSDSGIKRHYASTDRLRRLGFRPESNLQVSLGDIREYYLEQLSSIPKL